MWCPVVQLAGRSQAGQVQPRSRTLSALRAGPEIVRLARPTSITIDCESSTMRVTEASQASRSTVLAERGCGENSMSAPGAPGSPSMVSSGTVTCRWVRCVACCGIAPMSIACMASSTAASASRFSRLRSSCAPDLRASGSQAVRRAAPPSGSKTPLMSTAPSSQVVIVSLRFSTRSVRANLVSLGVERVSVVVADVVDLAGRVVPRLGQELGLVETAADEIGRPGHRLEMGKADLAVSHRLDGLGQALQVLADRNQVGGGNPGQVAVEANPLDRRDEAIRVVLVCVSK